MYITTVFTREELETMLAGGVVVYTGTDGISRQCEMENRRVPNFRMSEGEDEIIYTGGDKSWA